MNTSFSIQTKDNWNYDLKLDFSDILVLMCALEDAAIQCRAKAKATPDGYWNEDMAKFYDDFAKRFREGTKDKDLVPI